jgi:hypothetical protein
MVMSVTEPESTTDLTEPMPDDPDELLPDAPDPCCRRRSSRRLAISGSPLTQLGACIFN